MPQPTQNLLFGEIANDGPEMKRKVRAGVSSLIPLEVHYCSTLTDDPHGLSW